MQKEQNAEVCFLYLEFQENFEYAYGLEQRTAHGPTSDGRHVLFGIHSLYVSLIVQT